MKKSIVIIVMLFMSISSFAQFSRTPNKADEREIAEWKSSMKQITTGKTMVWSSIAVGGVATSAGLIAMASMQSHIDNGEVIARQVIDGNGNAVSTTSYESIQSTVRTAIIVTDIVCIGTALVGVGMQKQGRKKADRLYFGSGGLTYSF